MYEERRLFKRYPLKSGFPLKVGGSAFKAEVVDYSFDGLCVGVEGAPAMKKGDVLELSVSRPAFKGKAKVVWAKPVQGGVLVGFHREGILYGTLADYHLSDVILGLQRGGKTGILNFVHGSVHKNIYFKDGDMVFAASNQEEDRLGELLVREGKISREKFHESLELSRKMKKRHGSAMVDLGYIGPKTLFQAVSASVENIIEGLFSTKEGNLVFKEGVLPTEELITLKLSAANLIYRGIKRIEDVERIRLLCPPSNTVLVLARDPLDLYQDLRLEERDKSIVSLVDGRRTFKEIVQSAGGEVVEAMKILYALLNTRIIGFAHEQEPDYRAEPEEQEEPAVVTAEEVMAESEEPAAEDFVTRLESLYGRLRGLDFYEVLGVGKSAATTDIKKAYYRLAKDFHPDRHFQLPEEMKDKLNSVFSLITKAYAALVNPDRRKEYDEKPDAARQEVERKPEEMAGEKFRTGKSALSERKYEEAARLFAEAAYLESNVAEYHYYRGIALGKGGNHKEAERAIQRAIRIEPFNADYLAAAGHVYLALGLPLRAKSNFDKALKISPAHEMAARGLTMVAETPEG